MNENEINSSNPKSGLKIFFIKLFSISIVVVVVINLIFNLIFAERLEKIDKILFLDKSESRDEIKNKIRKELKDGGRLDSLKMNKKGQPLTKHIKMAKGGHVKSRGKALRGGGAEIK